MNELNETVETQEEVQQEEAKMFTQEEVDRLLQSEADRRVSEAMAKAERRKEAAVREAQKLASMNEQQKYEYELQQRENAIAEKESQLALLENKNAAGKILSDKGLSLELVDFVVAADAETMMANIKTLDSAFRSSVKAEVDRRMKTSIPQRDLPLSEAMTKEKFRSLSLAEQTKIYTQNPELYAKLQG